MDCPICGAGKAGAVETKRSRFFRCSVCSFVFRDSAEHPSARDAVSRYSLHRNTAEDPGYVSYLTNIIERVLAAAGQGVRSVVDWGSGPAAVCSGLLRASGFEVDSWDPHFSPERLPPAAAYDLALCIEVAEHFQDPSADFSELAARVRPGGVLAVHTHFVPQDDRSFRSWWYKEDPTHVSFYSPETLARLARICGLSPIAFEEGRLALFRRPLPVLVSGGANWDIEGRPFSALIPGDSNPGKVRFFLGGAGRNVAEDLARMGIAAEMVSVVGDDAPGREILAGCERAGIGAGGMTVCEGETTSSYLSILDEAGEAALALSGMTIFEGFDPAAALEAAERAVAASRQRAFMSAAPDGASAPPFSALVVDGNLRPETIEALLDRFPTVPAWFDPVSVAKARRIAAYRGGCLFARFRGIKPNIAEAEAMSGISAKGRDAVERAGDAVCALRSRGVDAIVYISLGAEGVYWSHGAEEGFFAPPAAEIVSTTGAGDAFLASAVRSDVLGFRGQDEAVRAAAAASFALRSAEAAPADISGAGVEAVFDRWRNGESQRGSNER